MSKEKRRVPKLRFPGFTEDWEQRKLGEYANFRRGSFPQPYGNKEWYDGVGSAPFVQVVDVGDNLSLVECTKQRISKLAQPMSVYAEKGSVLVTLQGSIGRVAVSQYDAFIDRTILIFQGYKYKTNSYFWAYIIKNKFFEEALKAPGGTIKTITKEVLSNFIILYPKFSEQEQIGSFFEKLDKLITLHQRKLDNLKLKKKALLQKLFPKNGERYPELRFPGFTDAWEQRKADYIFKSVTDKGYPELPVLSASQELGMVYRDQNGIDIQHDKKNETSYKRVLPGQFVIHLRSFQGGFAYSEIEGITSSAYTVMSFKNSSEQYGLFWKHVFKSETFIKRLETITYGIRDGRSISFSDFKSLLLQYPSFSEQKLIGDSIAVIERGITLHQRKLDHLQLQKKALLQQMFV